MHYRIQFAVFLVLLSLGSMHSIPVDSETQSSVEHPDPLRSNPVARNTDDAFYEPYSQSYTEQQQRGEASNDHTLHFDDVDIERQQEQQAAVAPYHNNEVTDGDFSVGRTGRWSAYVNKFKTHEDLLDHLISFLGEYTGTTLFIFLAFAPVNYINTHDIDAPSALLYNSLSFGMALAITARAFGQGHFNPALTLAQAVLNLITPLRAVILAIAQYTGALTGAAVVRLLTGSLATQTRITGINVGQAAVLEGLATAAFLFSVLMVAAKPKRVGILAPLEIAISLFITEMVSIGYSGGAENPCRALASDVVAHDYAHYSWIYQVSGYAGGLLAAGVYKFFEQIQELSSTTPADADFGIGLAAVVKDTDANDGGHLIGASDSRSVRSRRSHHTSSQHQGHSRHGSRAERMPISPMGQNFPLNHPK